MKIEGTCARNTREQRLEAEIITKAPRRHMDGFDFVRAVSSIGIICFHFACHSSCSSSVFLRILNYGSVFVSIFFALSGAALYLNYSDARWKTDLCPYLKKRWKSIFPVFYFTFALLFLKNAYFAGTLLYHYPLVRTPSLLLTLLGLDGYLLYAIPNYYIIGEWFLGAVILLYLLFPLLQLGINRSSWLTLAIVLSLYASMFFLPVKMDIFRTLPSCAVSFYFGMLLMRYEHILKSRLSAILCFAVFVICKVMPLPIHPYILIQIIGLCLFVVLNQVGELLSACKEAKKIIGQISKISFPIFLLQHVVILYVLERYNPEGTVDALSLLGITVMLTIFLSQVLHQVTHFLFFRKSR